MNILFTINIYSTVTLTLLHFHRNLEIYTPPEQNEYRIRAELQEMFSCETISAARKKCNEILESYSDVAASAMQCLDEGFDDSMTVMELPKGFRRYYRTSNHIERLNKELKRRSNVIGIFPNEESLLRFMGSVLIERNDAMQVAKAIFRMDSFNALMNTDTVTRLRYIAVGQKKCLAA